MMASEERIVRLAAALLTGGIALAGLLLVFLAIFLARYSELRHNGGSFKSFVGTGFATLAFATGTAVMAALRIAMEFPWGWMLILFVLTCLLVVALAVQAYKIATSD